MGIYEREALEAHLESYEEGYRDGYRKGFDDGLKAAGPKRGVPLAPAIAGGRGSHTKKRKLSAWNKFVKANSKKPRFVFRSGKLNLKKMGVAFKKTPAGKKKK